MLYVICYTCAVSGPYNRSYREFRTILTTGLTIPIVQVTKAIIQLREMAYTLKAGKPATYRQRQV